MAEERYEIRGKIGQGGVGVVYKAYDTQLRREVAIKRVLADELEGDSATATKNLLKEATALSSVQHPHICTVYDAGMDDDGPFVVMELINGKTLDEMVERGSLTYEDFREVAIQTQEAMIAAQELNLVHRDLKPSNVMVSWLPSGRFQIKLVDFGLAKFSAKPSLQTIDHGDAVFGSIFFMAPEQFERTPLDQRTDMYSLGAMYYYSLTGNYPFDGDTAPQVMASHLQNSVIPLQQIRPDLPVWLCEWVMWHIQRNMDHRPDSAIIALEKFLADESGLAQGTVSQVAHPSGAGAPLLRKLNTGIQGVSPATSITSPNSVQAGTSAVSAKAITAPQRILAPNGMPSTITSPVAIQPRVNLAPAHAYTNVASAPVHTTSFVTQGPQTGTMPVAVTHHKKPLNRKMVIVISSALLIAIIIISTFIFGASKKKNAYDSYQTLIKDIESKSTLTVTKEELQSLLDGMLNEDITPNQKIGGYTALSRAQAKDGAFSPTLEIAKFIMGQGSGIKDASMKDIFKAIRMNPNRDTEAHKVLLEYALANPDKAHTAEAINGMSEFADDSYIDNIINIYDKAAQLPTRNACAKTLTGIIKRSNDKAGISTKLIAKYTGAWEEDKKLAYLRLLGTTGSPEAMKILYDSLNNSDLSIKMSAFKALSNSPTIEPLDAMLKVYAAEKNEIHLSKYRSDIFDLLDANQQLANEQKIVAWMKIIKVSPTEKCSEHTFSVISGLESEFAKSLLKMIIASPDSNANTKSLATETLDSIE
jgi:serine/threonine protein kinase